MSKLWKADHPPRQVHVYQGLSCSGIWIVPRRAATKDSEYLPQRRKGRKENSYPNLALFAPWREKTPDPKKGLDLIKKLESEGLL